MSLVDINAVEEEARKQVAEETSDKAVKALVVLYKKLDAARDVVRNIEREIDDTKASIGDGSFTAK
jgi:acyl-coenzyme A synthetase/AMP-(fatty) acid ligase